jgi:HSP20 family protein
LSSDDKWFKRWGREMPFGPWSYADVEEMMKEMEKDFMDLKDLEKDIPKELVREQRAEDGSITKEVGPIVYGYSMTLGPDKKPVIREFGNVKRDHRGGWKEALTEAREPLVDIVDSDKEVRVIAELPGAKKDDVKLTAEGRSLTISVDTPTRKYRKELKLPMPVELDESKSSFNNGILEVTFPKPKGKSSGARTRSV